MIKEVIMYTVICDNCGVDANKDTEYSCWNDKGSAWDVAMDSDWTEHEGKHYCPDCFSYDDDDNIQLRKIEPK